MPHQPSNMRRTARLSLNQAVQVSLLETTDVDIDARVVDLSQDGIGLTAAVPLPLHKPVVVVSDGLLMIGRVRHCQGGPGAYRIGLQTGGCLLRGDEADSILDALHRLDHPAVAAEAVEGNVSTLFSS